MSTAEAPGRAIRPADEFRVQLSNLGGEIGNALPPHIPVERFMRVVLTAVNGNPDLLKCDRRTLFESSMKAAQDGLLPDGRDGALVKFGNAVQWMPMVGGILKKVRNSGELLSISAHVVYAADRFLYRLGDDETIEHEPAMIGDRGKPVAVYAIAKTKDGGIYREVMSVADVEKVRSVSRAKNAGPWVQWWDEMARKTVIRRLAKRLPMSTDLDDLIRRDDELYDFGGARDAAPPQETGLRARLAAARQEAPAEGFTRAMEMEPEPVEYAEHTPADDGQEQDAAGFDDRAPETAGEPAPATETPVDVIDRLRAALTDGMASGTILDAADVDAAAKPFAVEINQAKRMAEARKLVAEVKARIADAERGEVE